MGTATSFLAVDILSALFVENLSFRQAPGPATRIDLSGVMFSIAAESSDLPVTIEPHLVILVRCHANESGSAVLESVFRNKDGEQVARNVQPFQVEPGKFGYRLVKPELTFNDYETLEAHCKLDNGPSHIVPLTLLPPE